MANVPNDGGKKSEYAERLKRQRKVSAIKFYIVAIILGALIGLAYIKRDEIVTAYNSFMGAKPPPAPPPVVPQHAPIVVEKKLPVEAQKRNQDAVPTLGNPPATVVIDQQISPKDEAKARGLLDEGKALLEAFDFDGASQKFEQASTIKLGPALKDESQIWRQKAVEFLNATKHIAVADYAKTDKAVSIETTSGDEIRAIKIKDDNESVYVQQVNEANPAAEGIQKFPIPTSEIKKITPMPLAKRRAEFTELVLAQESGTTISHSTDYYDLVYLCKRLNLGKECMMYLNRAFDGGPGHAADPKLGDSLRMVVVRRVIGRATLLISGGRRLQVIDDLKKLGNLLPDFAPAGDAIASFHSEVLDKVKSDFRASVKVTDTKVHTRRSMSIAASEGLKAKPPVREEALELVVDNLTSTGPAAKVLEHANAKFNEGMCVLRKYTVGVGGNKNDNNRILLQAKALLVDAIDLYEDALKLEPGNRAMKDRQQTASQMVYFCNKNMII